jgi:hypothetical protein
MNHLSEEELILHYYGEEGDSQATRQHLDQCERCRAIYGRFERVLHAVDSLPVPVREAEYGAQVWRRIESRIPARRRWWGQQSAWRWAGGVAALASLLMVAFLAGRFYPAAHKSAPAESVADKQAGERVLLVAVGDFLERSQLVLIELNNANAAARLDISADQERAADLVSENRLYRQTAVHNGNAAMAGVLEDLERVLVDISHAPSQLSPADLDSLRRRFESAGILFKIRVLGTNVRNQQDSAGPKGEPAGQVGQPAGPLGRPDGRQKL